jgi:hypothetical protein
MNECENCAEIVLQQMRLSDERYKKSETTKKRKKRKKRRAPATLHLSFSETESSYTGHPFQVHHTGPQYLNSHVVS